MWQKSEEINKTCIIDKVCKKKNWMFWSCFNDTTKESEIFWEKNWDWIDQESYCAHIVSVIDDLIHMNPDLQLM